MAEIVRFALRLPPELHQALQRLARRDRRSLHGQIIYVLERYVAHEEGELEGKAAA
jgi:hypothetical protein